MISGIKAVIWDWGRTLFDSESKKEYPEAQEILEYVAAQNIKQVVVSLVSPQSNATLDERQQQIEYSPLRLFFQLVLVTDENKEDSLDEALSYLDLSPEEILIIDDRTIRGIKYANQKGCRSIWIQQGPFANELPNAETGEPTYTVKSLKEIRNII